jgi:hypothetical protein
LGPNIISVSEEFAPAAGVDLRQHRSMMRWLSGAPNCENFDGENILM